MAVADRNCFDSAWIARNYGALVPSSKLALLLGFPSAAALRQAKSAGRLNLRLFAVQGRRGLFANAEDVGEYLRAHRSIRERSAP
jgi:hypothetical protein